MGGNATGPLPIGSTASSATKELDDLMASLSDFKVALTYKLINRLKTLILKTVT